MGCVGIRAAGAAADREVTAARGSTCDGEKPEEGNREGHELEGTMGSEAGAGSLPKCVNWEDGREGGA